MRRLIVAVGTQNIIGVGDHLPWPFIPADMNMFRTLTSSQIVVMGHATYKSIPPKFRPLPNRINAVVTKSILQGPVSVEILTDLNNSRLMQLENKFPDCDIWIIGGASIYQQAIAADLVDEAYVTRVGNPDYRQLPEDFTTASLEDLEKRGFNRGAIQHIRQVDPEGKTFDGWAVTFDPESLKKNLRLAEVSQLCSEPLTCHVEHYVRRSV